jgi:hypothetical protein
MHLVDDESYIGLQRPIGKVPSAASAVRALLFDFNLPHIFECIIDNSKKRTSLRPFFPPFRAFHVF